MPPTYHPRRQLAGYVVERFQQLQDLLQWLGMDLARWEAARDRAEAMGDEFIVLGAPDIDNPLCPARVVAQEGPDGALALCVAPEATAADTVAEAMRRALVMREEVAGMMQHDILIGAVADEVGVVLQ